MIDRTRAYRKMVSIALIFLFLPLMAHSQASWKTPAHTWGGAGSDYADSVAMDSQGNAYVAGATNSFGAGGSDVLLLKYDPAGNLLWAKTWGGASDEYATSVAVGPDGSIYITGGTSSFSAGWFDFFLLKLDTGGNLQWATTWGGGSYDVGHDIGFDASGNIYVAGETYSFGPCCSSAALIKFSPSGGSPIWAKTWKGPATYDGAYSLTVDSQGSVIVSGISWDYSVFPHHNSLLLIKYDSAGNFLWSENWNSPIPADDESWSFRALTTDSTGNIYIGGRHTNQCLTDDFSQCDFDAFVMQLDSGGNFLWARTWGGSGYDTPASVAINPTGHLLVSGIDDVFGTPLLSVLTYDTAGNLLSRTAWSTQAMVPGTAQAGMTLDPLGNVFVVSAASNNSGAWGSIPANATPMTNSLVSNPFSLGSPVGSVALFTNPPIVSQSRIGDTGGGGMDVLVTQLTLSPPPPMTGPLITSVSPASGNQGQIISNFTVNGSNFDPSVTLSFSAIGVAVNSYISRTANQIVASVSIANGAPPGPQDVIVTNSDSQQNKLSGAFNVDLAPPIAQPAISIAPNLLDFGTVAVRKNLTKAIHIQNTGTVPLFVTNISSTDASFAITPASLGPIDPGGSLAISVTFSPIQQGTTSSVLKITSNAATSGTFVQMTGVGSNAQSGRLVLAYSNDAAPNHPLYLTATPTFRTGKEIIADVTLTNVTGTWYEVTLNSQSGTAETPNPIPVQNIPFAFLVGPFQQKTFTQVQFPEGAYLQLDTTRLSVETVSMLAIDLIGRGIFGTRLTDFAPNGFLDLSLGALPTLVAKIKTNCSGPALALGLTVGSTTSFDLLRALKIIGRLSDFMRCTVEDPQIREALSNLITSLYSSDVAAKWIQFSFKTISEVIFVFTHVQLLAELADQTLTAASDGFARIEARHL